jgi:secondary thiamine-phosphate synthase enzyme
MTTRWGFRQAWAQQCCAQAREKTQRRRIPYCDVLESRRQQGDSSMQTLSVRTERRTQLVDVTAEVQKVMAASGVASGICYLYVPHTTAAITINECADPDVARDVESAMDRLIPKTGPYRHSEGNSDSHVKAVLVGTSQMVLVEGGKLVLGRWQGVFFCEFDGPRDRRLQVKVVSG